MINLNISTEEYENNEDEINQDFDDNSEYLVERDDEYVQEALDAIETLESHKDFLIHSSVDYIDYNSIKLINDYNRFISRKYNFNYTRRSLEAYDEDNPYQAIEFALEDIDLALEKISLELFNGLMDKIKNMISYIKNGFNKAKVIREKLNKVDLRKFNGEQEINFSRSNLFIINNKFDPKKVLDTANDVYEEEVIKGGWCKLLDGCFSVIDNISNKLENVKTEEEIPAIIEKELEKNLKDNQANYWKPSPDMDDDGRPNYEVKIGDNIKILKSKITPKSSGLLGAGYKWIQTDNKEDDSDAVKSCDIDTLNYIKRHLDIFINSEKNIIDRIDEKREDLSKLAKKIEVKIKGANESFYKLKTLAIALLGVMSIYGLSKVVQISQDKFLLNIRYEAIIDYIDKNGILRDKFGYKQDDVIDRDELKEKLKKMRMDEWDNKNLNKFDQEINNRFKIADKTSSNILALGSTIFSLIAYKSMAKATKRTLNTPSDMDQRLIKKLIKNSELSLSKLKTETDRYQSTVISNIVNPFSRLILAGAEYALKTNELKGDE